MAITWSESTVPAGTFRDVQWVAFLSLWVAVGDAGKVATSPDGVTWTSRTAATADNWRAVAASGSVVVAVSSAGTVMSSTDAITWTSRTAAEANAWRGVCWASGLSLFVAVANSGTHRVMTSPDGITWTARTAAAALNWRGVCWSTAQTLLVAVASDAGTGSVMTSPDGTTWTQQTTASLTPTVLTSGNAVVCWSPGIALFAFCAVVGGNPKVMTSPDGVTWTARSLPGTVAGLGVLDAPAMGVLVANRLGNVENPIITSPDGITWTDLDPGVTHVLWESAGWSEALTQYVATEQNGVHSVFLVGDYQAATFTSLTPTSGTILGGTLVTCFGTGLSGVTDVKFGGTSATDVAVVNDTTVICRTPAHAAGLVNVEVVGVGTLVNAYTYRSVLSIRPDRGTILGGTPVTIFGGGFSGATNVKFDSVAALSFDIVNDTTITAVTPGHATAGPVDVEVTTVGTLTGGYTYQALRKVTLPPIPIHSEPKVNPDLVRWIMNLKKEFESQSN